MSVKFYEIAWLVFLGIVGIFFLSGNLTPVVSVVFGLVLFGMVFMGMMSVLPGTIMHPAPSETAGTSKMERSALPKKAKDPSSASNSSWMPSSGIDVQRARFH